MLQELAFFCTLISVLSIKSVNGAGELGSACDWDADCVISISTCIHNICACDDGHVVDTTETKCAVENGELCTVQDQCYDLYASCQRLDPSDMFNSTSKCLCIPEYVMDPTLGHCAAAIGTICNINADCVSDGICDTVDGVLKCKCQAELLPNFDGSKCLPGLNATCSTGKECADSNAVCDTNNKCDCGSKFEETLRNNIPVCLTRLAHICAKGEECADLSATCMQISRQATKFGKCWCKPTYVLNSAKTICLSIADKKDGDCQEDRQCIAFLGRGAKCDATSKQCNCQAGYAFDTDENKCTQTCSCTALEGTLQYLNAKLHKVERLLDVIFSMDFDRNE